MIGLLDHCFSLLRSCMQSAHLPSSEVFSVILCYFMVCYLLMYHFMVCRNTLSNVINVISIVVTSTKIEFVTTTMTNNMSIKQITKKGKMSKISKISEILIILFTSSTVVDACKDDFPSLNSVISLLVALMVSFALLTAASSHS